MPMRFAGWCPGANRDQISEQTRGSGHMALICLEGDIAYFRTSDSHALSWLVGATEPYGGKGREESAKSLLKGLIETFMTGLPECGVCDVKDNVEMMQLRLTKNGSP